MADKLDTPPSAPDEAQRFQHLLQASLAAHQAGGFAPAEAGYREILARFPGHAVTRDLLGTLLYQTRRAPQSAAHLRLTVSLEPAFASAWNHLGAVRISQGRDQDALRAFARANAADPGNVEAWLNRSRIAEKAGDLDQAVSAAGAAAMRFPGLAAAHARHGAALLARQEPEEAVSSLERAVAGAPLEIEPYLHLSLALKRSGESSRSQVVLRKAILIAPSIAALYPHLTDKGSEPGRETDLVAWARRVICLAPRDSRHWAQLAAACEALKEDEAAALAARRSLLLSPDAHAAHQCFALSLLRLDRFEEAGRASRQALLLYPDISEIRFVASTCAFVAGDTATGWEYYEARMDARIDTERVGLPPLWDRQSDPGHLFVAAEQGVGDEYIFLSRLFCLEGRASEVTVECDRRNRTLFGRSFPGIRFIDRQIIGREGAAPYFDYRKISRELGFDRSILAASLLAMSITHPEEAGPRSFLIPDPSEAESWRRYFRKLTQLPLVGICWRGGTSSPYRDSLYCDAESMIAALGTGGAFYVNLVYNPRPGELEKAIASQSCDIHDPAGIRQKDELDRMAALLSVLDAVVSVDTAVASLSAAVGTPTLRLGHSLLYLSEGHDAILGSSIPMNDRAAPLDMQTCLARAGRRLPELLEARR